jgi:cytochrome P450
VLIPNTFLHRDRDRFDYADRFAPERWVDGDAREQWSFNHFSRGPQVCPGIGIATLLGTAVLGTVLRERGVELESPSIDPEKPLPHMLDPYSVKVAV